MKSLKRLNSLISTLASQKISSFLIKHPPNLRYFLELDFLPHPGEIILLVTQKKTTLLVSPLINLTIGSQTSISFRTQNRHSTNFILHAIDNTRSNFGIDSPFSLQLIQKLTSSQIHQLTNIQNHLVNQRSRKTTLEQKNISKAAGIASTTINQLIKNHLKPGVTEKKLAQIAKELLFSNGSSTLPFEPIIAFGPHSSWPHHNPTNYQYSNDLSALIDLGASYNGYQSDTTRTILPQKPTQLHLKLQNAVMECFYSSTNLLSQNVPLNQIVSQASVFLNKVSPQAIFSHSLGHGIGLEVHEAPFFSPQDQNSVNYPTAFALEPALYITNKFGFRHEDTFIINSSGKLVNLTN